ncbi:MAG: hypothetical protein C4538_10555, partial [Nitrospiraceae bacterium]
VVGTPSSYYPITQLQAVYDAAGSGAIIQSKVATYTGDFTIGQSKTVTIQGGYDCGYTTPTGKTTVSGNITINNGKVTMENVHVQ